MKETSTTLFLLAYRYFGQVPGMTTRSQEYQRLLEAGYEKEAAGLEKDGLYKPTMGENISFFKDYQINWMYVRYFLWNFAGRQNDTQGYGLTGPGSEILRRELVKWCRFY